MYEKNIPSKITPFGVNQIFDDRMGDQIELLTLHDIL